MRRILIFAVASMALAGAQGASAHKHAAKPAEPVAGTASKAHDCAEQWKAEKNHIQTKKDFMAACRRG